jgi:hypothetical protein
MLRNYYPEIRTLLIEWSHNPPHHFIRIHRQRYVIIHSLTHQSNQPIADGTDPLFKTTLMVRNTFPPYHDTSFHHKFIRQPSTNSNSKTPHYIATSASTAAPATASPGFRRSASSLPPAPAEMTATTPFVVTWPAAVAVLGMKTYTTVPDVMAV